MKSVMVMRKRWPCKDKGLDFSSKNCKPPVGYRVNGLGYECKDCPPREVLGEVNLMEEAERAIKEAWELQESIRKRRAQLKRDEEHLQNLFETLAILKVTRIGKLEVQPRVSSRRQIVSERFLAIWPDLFNKIAKVNIKDALTVIDENELNQVCEVRQIASWEIISYAKPGEMV